MTKRDLIDALITKRSRVALVDDMGLPCYRTLTKYLAKHGLRRFSSETGVLIITAKRNK